MTPTAAVPPSVSRTPLPLDADDLATVCVLCSHNCAVRVDVRGGAITAVRGDESSPISHGYLCNKAMSVPHYVRHGQRVERPLRRRPDGGFDQIDWDTAIAEIAARLGAIVAAHGPRAFGLVGVGGQANHLDGPYALGFMRALGSRRWFCAFAQEKTQHPLVDGWMFGASPATYLHADQRNARFLLVLGTNPRISNRGHNANDYFQSAAKEPGRTVVVVDPRETETARNASRHLQLHAGTDVWLLLGMAASIVRRGLHDEAFVRSRCEGFDALREALAAVDPDEMARRTGLARGQIEETAEAFARAESAAIMFDLGVEQTPFSTLIAYLLRVLLVLTNNVGRPGGNVFFENFIPPAQEPGRRREPERALASGIPAIAALGNFGMFSPTLVPEEVMLDHPERLRAVFVEGANPFLSYSDTQAWRTAREHLDLLVVIEPAMTETARAADYVLPAPVGYEKWEFANFPKSWPEVLVQVRPPVVPGPAEALPEAEIYARLASALGLVGAPPAELLALAKDALTPEGAMAFLGAAQAAVMGERPDIAKERLLFWSYATVGEQLPAPSLAAIWLQCHLNGMLRLPSVLRTLGAEWADASPFAVGTELFRRVLAHPEGVEIARVDERTNLDDNVTFPDGRIRLVPDAMPAEIARALATAPHVDPEYPLVLAAGLRTRWTANTIHRDPAWRKGRGPHCTLGVSPADAARLGIRAGAPVRVVTRRGALEMPAQVDPKLLPGHVWMPNGFGMAYQVEDGTTRTDGANQNELTDVADRDPFTGVPHHRYVRCRVEPVAG